MATKDKDKFELIAENRKARHNYHIEAVFEAGIVLEGWEVKSLRAGRAQIAESYVIMKDGEAWLIGSHISPLSTASTHVKPDPTRSRKLLLHARELSKLIGAVQRQGYSIVPLNLHWTRGRAKLEIALGRGKKEHDKREDIKKRDWQRQKQRLMKL
jgi:SsrA-binding protein